MKNLIVLTGIMAIILAMVILADAQRPARIHFAKGATHANISGTLNSYRTKRVYVIRVRAGQTLRTEQSDLSRGGSITIFVTGPAGEDVGDSDASCNNRREITPTVAGDYRIEVVECQKGDPWRGPFRFRVTVR